MHEHEHTTTQKELQSIPWGRCVGRNRCVQPAQKESANLLGNFMPMFRNEARLLLLQRSEPLRVLCKVRHGLGQCEGGGIRSRKHQQQHFPRESSRKVPACIAVACRSMLNCVGQGLLRFPSAPCQQDCLFLAQHCHAVLMRLSCRR